MIAPPDVQLDAQPSPAPRGGVVRPARRPPGWIAPGPRPATPPDRPEVWPGPGEDLCYLSGDFRILQRLDGHRWSADDLVTAWFAAERVAHAPPRRAVDLGCGIGTVLLFTAWRFPDARCAGVEAQEVSAAMARRSVGWNGLDARCEVRWGDLRDTASVEGLGPAGLVTGTPPYLPVGTGIESSHLQRGPCRFEHRGGVEDYCLTAARLLAPGAPFVACASARQRGRVEAAAAAAGLALVAWRDVVPKEGKAALFSVYALRRAGEAAPPSDEPPLVLRGTNGRFTEEFNALCRTMGMPV
ncbi:tRNA1(Val) (adenine(37)-N6)-methyltransferase [Sorangium sp. So ce406]|uniref:tRNA1(Val) (adenine(37)-N6)-methyltransferase n=1 Tax=Sorangium sp. So ce406 TaxID=3133311 RepID=UPI003F5C7953